MSADHHYDENESWGYIEPGSYADRYWESLGHPSEFDLDAPADVPFEVTA